MSSAAASAREVGLNYRVNNDVSRRFLADSTYTSLR
jgi:hypothetical protein